jgi:hypothetical protein
MYLVGVFQLAEIVRGVNKKALLIWILYDELMIFEIITSDSSNLQLPAAGLHPLVEKHSSTAQTPRFARYVVLPALLKQPIILIYSPSCFLVFTSCTSESNNRTQFNSPVSMISLWVNFVIGSNPAKVRTSCIDWNSTYVHVYNINVVTRHPLPAKVGTNFADKRRSLGRYSSLAG